MLPAGRKRHFLRAVRYGRVVVGAVSRYAHAAHKTADASCRFSFELFRQRRCVLYGKPVFILPAASDADVLTVSTAVQCSFGACFRNPRVASF